MMTVIKPESLLQTFYLLASVAVFSAYFTPAFHQRFLAYGARDTVDPALSKDKKSIAKTQQQRASSIDRLLDQVADIKVPHKWFTHFYVVSVVSSAFWAYQIMTRGSFYTFIESYNPETGNPEKCLRVAGCWFWLALQGVRRLYESLRLPQSSSKMWIGHYAIGIAFYLATGIAIWIEGIPALKSFFAWRDESEGDGVTYTIWPVPLLDVFANICVWEAFYRQHMLHKHLASLKKYSLPTESEFQWIVAPHYTCECIIYCSLAFLSRPDGLWCNRTMATAFAFVVINLGVNADGIKKWMRSKFGDASVAAKWRMLPRIW